MGRRYVLVTGLLLLACVMAIHAERPSDLDEILAFEVEQPGERPAGWTGGPADTLFVDGEVVHGGHWAGRIERTAGSDREFSSMTRKVDVDFAGRTLELRAYLKTEDVAGWAGLWLREDDASGSIAFKNNQELNIHGTTDWTEYTLRLPFNPKARELWFGAMLIGEGRVWVDDVRILLDGKPLSEAPLVERETTVLDTDTEFDDGSGIAIDALSDIQIDNLARLGRVWGFLKYHHTAVTAGKHHWDFGLFRVLPAILEAEDRNAANAALLRWIDGLGDVPPCERCAKLPDEDVHLKPPLDWIDDDETLGSELATALRRIHVNRDRRGRHFFVGPASIGVGNPEFRNEPLYKNVTFPDSGFQLLALFRYWNMIQYWFPYRDVIGEPWDGVLLEYVPELALAETRAEFEASLATLIARINDTHGYFHTTERPPRGDCAVPARLRMVEGSVVVDRRSDTGLEPGDVIESLDGVAVEEMLAAWAPYYGASNEPTRNDHMVRELTRGECGDVVVTGRRGTKPFRKTLERVRPGDRRQDRTRDRPGETFQLLDERVAYLKLSSVEVERAAEYVERAAGTRGLIVDIRNYPAGSVVFPLGTRFVDRLTPFARFTKPHFSNPGTFTFTVPMTLAPAKPYYAGKIVILVDETSISHAEYTAMSLRAGPNAVVVGSTTAGADGNVSRIPLPGGMRTMISGIGVFYPDNEPTQRVGIVPDIEARPTIEGIRAGRDELLERATREILGPDAGEEEVRRIAAPDRE